MNRMLHGAASGSETHPFTYLFVFLYFDGELALTIMLALTIKIKIKKAGDRIKKLSETHPCLESFIIYQ